MGTQKAFLTILALLLLLVMSCGHKDVGNSPDYVLVKDGYPVATFYGFVPDIEACEDVAEIFNREALRKAYWCERPK